MRGRLVLYIGLLCLWIYWAYGFFQRGQTGMGIAFLAIGAALFFWRIRRLG